MKAINARESLTPREREEYEQEKEVARLQADYKIRYRELELEIEKIQVKWTQVFRIPFAIINLPVRFVMAFAVIASAVTKKDLPEKFWDYLGKL